MTDPQIVRVDSVEALGRWLEPRIETVRCVSFDIFDTLLARCIEPPDDLHRRSAELLAARLRNIDIRFVLACRREAEAELRRKAISNGMDHECHFDPLVDAWVTRLVGHSDPELIEFAQDTERELESFALIAKPGVVDLLRHIRSRCVRVLAVSDMYLGHDHLEEILDGCGLGGLIDRIYVSSEFGLGKYSGRLHAKVLELEKITAEEIIHIGDNLQSDMRAPVRLGLRGVFLDERAERLRRRQQTLSAEMANLGGVWPGRRFAEIVDYRMLQDTRYRATHEDFFHHYGAHVLGPVFGAFLLGLTERIKTTQPDKVFFIARDGFLFKKMYERWRELDPYGMDWPEPIYLYASRRVVATASVAEGLTPEQAAVAFYNPKQQGLLSVLKTFGLPDEEFTKLARLHGFQDMAGRLSGHQDPRLQSFLADEQVQARIRAIGEAARNRLQRYFSQMGFFSARRVALIDIGWNGTIQKFLKDSFGERSDYPDVYGWYFAFVAALHGDLGMGDRVEGLILDARRNNPWERAPMDFEEIFEQGARSGEGTTLGYRERNGEIVPHLKDDSSPDRRNEIACNPLIERFQEGVMTHLDHFHAAWKLTGYDFSDLRPYTLSLLERAVVYPTREEVTEIGRLMHTEDFGHDHILDISAAKLGYLDLLRPRRLYRILQHRAWKSAAFTSFGWALPGWLFRYAYLNLVRRRGY